MLGLAALLVAVPAALAGSSHRVANSASFPDSTGEDANAPDITSVNVSNDDAGLITFQVNISEPAGVHRRHVPADLHGHRPVDGDR